MVIRLGIGLLIFLFLLFCQISAKKERVILIGIDGYMEYCMDKAKHESLDLMMERGSYSMNARTTIIPISAPGWSNILCGLNTESSGIVRNEWYPPWIYSVNNGIASVTGNDPLPCIFEHIKKGFQILKSHHFIIGIGLLT
jgi:hypothetical protein